MGFKISHLWKHKKDARRRLVRLPSSESSPKRNSHIEEAPVIQNTQSSEEILTVPSQVELSEQEINTANVNEENDSINIEEQVTKVYEKEISELQIKDSLKDYLRRSLRTVVSADENDKLFLLEIRQQLKQSSFESTHSTQYVEFLKFIDKLYFLALDKSFSHFQHSQPRYSFRAAIRRLHLARLSRLQHENTSPDNHRLQDLIQPREEQEEGQQIREEQEQQDTQMQNSFPNVLSQQRREIQRLTLSLRRRIDSFSQDIENSNNDNRTESTFLDNRTESTFQRDVVLDYLERWPSLIQQMNPSFFRLSTGSQNQDNSDEDSNQLP